MEVLNIKNLNFSYKNGKNIYKNFNLSLQIDEIIGIVGASGVGKSTLFELILGNLVPNSGEIYKKKVSIVFQDPFSSFHPHYTIFEQIKDINVNLQYLDKLLIKLNLKKSLLYKKSGSLSGGELQRLSLVRALLYEPDLLLLDEPTSAVDNIISYELISLIKELRNNFGTLLITHDINLAKWCSDKIIKISNKI